MEDLKRYLHIALNKVEGLHSILVSDADGVVILKAYNDKVIEQNHNFKPSFFAEVANASESSGKSELGKTKTVILYCKNNLVVLFNCEKLLLTFVASENADTGSILALRTFLDPLLKDTAAVLFS